MKVYLNSDLKLPKPKDNIYLKKLVTNTWSFKSLLSIIGNLKKLCQLLQKKQYVIFEVYVFRFLNYYFIIKKCELKVIKYYVKLTLSFYEIFEYLNYS